MRPKADDIQLCVQTDLSGALISALSMLHAVVRASESEDLELNPSSTSS